ncbi:pyridoxal-dependent decarboxylase, exosortase A system-associated [Magnetospira sp. QH-2]|uniref:pyridoxal-dependent decarboxylase, exosortase A system-associated n=1 Tax=Magnetospira sp. (strain QH-2) TaxID=1288970 RepID=UPI0003E81785|nr:pyridoxal-dependent decarboxylase, exosortase A system-associated [Magnetospira sp. QH-2]CCQ72907.1 diaminopimelate decarboxylase [Magnetospira sp. QH-2]
MNAARNFPVVDGQISVGGVPLFQYVEQNGGSPLYIYSRDLIDKRVSLLRKHLPDAVHLSYAIKANPMPDVVKFMAERVDGFDIASAGELKTVLQAPMPVDNISFAGPGKTDMELRQALEAGVTVNLESAGELERLVLQGEQTGCRPRVAIRVNPDFELKGSGMRMGGGAKPFGVDADQVPGLLRRLADLDLDFQGFHIFTGSQNLRADLVTEAQGKVVDLALSLAEQAPSPIQLLNLGGGFGIPYFPGDEPLDLAAVGAGMAPLVKKISAAHPAARIVVELGRYLVGEAGLYVTRVVDRKQSRGKTFLVTDGGLHHHLAASGNFGQILRRNYPVAVGNRMAEAATETVTVVGCLCTPLDILADGVDLPRAEVGDLIVVFQSGAYGPTASPSAFLGHAAPAEYLV